MAGLESWWWNEEAEKAETHVDKAISGKIKNGRFQPTCVTFPGNPLIVTV